MKKFLSVTSLVLVAVMLFSFVPASAETVNAWEAPEGITIYYATDLTDADAAPLIDGEISDDEYGDPIASLKPADALKFAGAYPDCDSKIDDTRTNQPASDNIDFYVAYDEEYIYIAFEDEGGTWEDGDPIYEWLEDQLKETDDAGKIAGFAARNNYHINTGFYLTNVGDLISMQASSRGFDENKIFQSGSCVSSGDRWKAPDSIVDYAYIKKTLVADDTVVAEAPGGFKNDNGGAVRGNQDTYVGQYNCVVELRYSKQKLVNLMNELYMDEMLELPNAMWLRFTARTYPVKEAANAEGVGGSAYNNPYLGYNNYFVNDVRVDNEDLEYNADDYIDYGLSASANFMYSLVVFGDEDTELSEGRWEGDPEYPEEGETVGTAAPVATTEAATTEAAEDDDVATTEAEAATTAAPVTEAVDDDDADETEAKTEAKTEAPKADDESKGGCGSTVSIAGLALVATLGTCTVFVSKKRD